MATTFRKKIYKGVGKMEDDEEFSYSGYSKNTLKDLKGDAAFKDSEEDFSYSEFAGEAAFAAEEKTASYGDYIVEEFSAENNANRVAKITKLPAHIATYCVSALSVIVGILCVALTSHITEILPYIVGGMMTVAGMVQFVIAIVQKEYKHLKTNRTATSFIVFSLGIMIILQKIDPESDPVMLISVVWGMLGLFEGAHAFNHALKRISNSERCVFYFLRGIVECSVAFMLLYHPESHNVHFFHIMVFGINLIFDGITMLPPVKSFLAMK